MRRIIQHEDGQSLVEYAMIIGLVAALMVGSLMQLVQVPILDCFTTIVASL